MTRRDAAGRGAYLGGLLLVLLPCLAAGQRSDTIRVTFEEFPDTAPAGVTAKVPRPVGHPGTFRGVRFPGLLVLDLGGVPRLDGVPRSGTRVAALCLGGEGCRDSIVNLEFGRPQRRVRIWAGALFPSQLPPVAMRAYDRSGGLVAADSAAISGAQWPRIQVALEAAADSNAISRVVLSAPGPGWRNLVLDDLEFVRDRPPPPPPPPPPPESTARTKAEVATQVPPPPRRPPIWPAVVGAVLVALGVVLGNRGARVGPELPRVTAQLADSGLSRRAARVLDPNPVGVVLKLALVDESVRVVEHSVREREG